MKISTTTDALFRIGGDEYALRTLARIGFDATDFSLFNYHGPSSPLKLNERELVAYFTHLKNVCREVGIEVGQSHAPMPTYSHGSDNNDVLFSKMVASIYASESLDCPYCVIHPPILPDRRYNDGYEENRDICLDVYSRLIPHLERTGVKLAVENMFNWDPEKGKICPTICSSAKEMAYYVDTLGDCFVNCLDIGHTNLTKDTGETTEDMIRILGGRLKTLHVHDNDGIRDAHTIPYYGNINWDGVCGALKEIGYSGTFSFEADEFVKMFPEQIRIAALGTLLEAGRYLTEKIK